MRLFPRTENFHVLTSNLEKTMRDQDVQTDVVQINEKPLEIEIKDFKCLHCNKYK